MRDEVNINSVLCTTEALLGRVTRQRRPELTRTAQSFNAKREWQECKWGPVFFPLEI